MADIDPNAPVPLVMLWLDGVYDRRDLKSVWMLADDDYRLALAQEWIWVNDQNNPNRVVLADTIANGTPTDGDWARFATWVYEKFGEFCPHCGEGNVRFDQGKGVELLAPNYEVVWASPYDPDADSNEVAADAPPMASAWLVHHTDDGWRIACDGRHAVTPGWPPKSHNLAK